MARTATSLKLRPIAINPAFLRHFSSSSSSPNPNFETQNSPENSESMFADVKASLQQPPPPRQQFGRQEMPRQQFGRQEMPRQQVSVDRIKRDLGEFRLRSAAPPVNPVSFQELYKRHVASKETNPDHETNKDFTQSFSAIRDSLRQLRGNTPKPKEGGFSLSSLKDTFASRPDPRNPGLVIGSPQKIPGSEFSKNMIQNEEEDTSLAMKTAFVKMYSYKELGEKLRKLRPEGKSGGGFSLEELNERLVKLREMEERERDSKIGNEAFRDLRASLVKMKISDNKKTMKRIDFLNNFGQTSTLMLDPPKEHLVEKYFHPDNMSSAEKLKIELQKVRDEFKMSESDCGSARVQVAQLTTKIKHLATALHPKDKHSRKGLKGMIEQRKKLLKYLRRTDWDSYTLVLSKFNLKDKPDYKN